MAINQNREDRIHSPTSLPIPKPSSQTRAIRRWLTGLLLLLAIGAVVSASVTSLQDIFFLTERFQAFVTIFLGIFIEAAPFLLAGSIVSGFIAVFVNQAMIDRYLPKQPIGAALAGALMGLIFPVCECGVVPVTRRLYEKGLPTSIGIAFLLAAPVINPIVFISTYAAFGWGAIFVGRIVFSALVAFVVGLIFHVARPQEILLPSVLRAKEQRATAASRVETVPRPLPPMPRRIGNSLRTAGDDFLDMARYLIAGSMLAAAMQTLVPQTALLAVGQGPIISVLAMQAMAFVLSVCSTVDAFLALAFAGSFSTGSILAFLTFGPMVDIKSSLMFLGVFQKRIVAYLILLPLLLTLLIGISWNLYL